MMILFKMTTMALFLVASIPFYSTQHDYDLVYSKKKEITVQSLSKKWKLDKYKISFFSEAPAENEKNDYIHLKSDMTFESVSEGVLDTGNWRLDAQKKRIYMSNENEEGELVFIVDELKSKKLVLIIDDPSDSDAKYLKIHFKL